MIFREKIERRRSGGGGGGGGGVGARLYVERGVGKEPELPDLNKVNFLAIWPVFGIVGEP